MKKIFLTGIVLLLTIAPLLAVGNTAAIWQRGNELYKQKQYDSAAAYYEQIAAGKPYNAEIYYNLGNTYYRLNKVGMAILNYERVLKISPNYKDAKDNLFLTEARMSTRMQDANDIFFLDWWTSLTDGARQKTWAIWSLLTFVGIVGVQLINKLRKSGRMKFLPQVTGVLVLAWIGFMVLAFASAQNAKDSMEAVVMQNDAPLMTADLKGKPLSLIPEGTIVKIKDTRAGYTEVRLPDGRTGWLQQTLINKI